MIVYVEAFKRIFLLCQQKSNHHLRLDVRVGLISYKLEILKLEIEDIRHMRIKVHLGQLEGFARELFLRLFQMIGIQMRIAKSVNELTRF